MNELWKFTPRKQKTKRMNIATIITAICSLLFLTIGVDKFLAFLEPPCSLMSNTPPTVWKAIGVLQFAGGILIWFPKIRKYVAGFFMVFMVVVTINHLLQNTYDIGGSAFMAVILSLLVWNPSLFQRKFKEGWNNVFSVSSLFWGHASITFQHRAVRHSLPTGEIPIPLTFVQTTPTIACPTFAKQIGEKALSVWSLKSPTFCWR